MGKKYNLLFELDESQLQKLLDESYDNRKIAIWGSGSCAERFIEKIPSIKEHILFYIDKSSNKWGTMIDGILVISPQEFFEKHEYIDSIFIATMYFDDVLKELEANNYSGDVFGAFHIVFRYGQCDYRPLEQNIDCLKSWMNDAKSINILDFMLEHRKNMDVDYSDICEPNQYFVKEIVPRQKDAIFVDGGAYHGETILEFIDFQNGDYKKILSFEMDENNYKRIKKTNTDDRISLLNYGLWSKHLILKYNSDSTSSAIGDDGDMTAECISIDEVLNGDKATFIKMDIEGAEMEALLGAEKTIRRWKPILTICVYHKPEDIYTITKLIHNWLPNHKLYLRHHSTNFTETVLYAIP